MYTKYVHLHGVARSTWHVLAAWFSCYPMDRRLPPYVPEAATPCAQGSLMSGFVLALLYHQQQGLPPAVPAEGQGQGQGKSEGSGEGKGEGEGRGEGKGEGEGRGEGQGEGRTKAEGEAELGVELELCGTLRLLWSSYEATLRAEGVSEAQLHRISEDSAGYAAVEVRTESVRGQTDRQ